MSRNQNQNILLMKRQNDNTSIGFDQGRLVPSSPTREEEVNPDTQSSNSSAGEIRDPCRSFRSLIVLTDWDIR